MDPSQFITRRQEAERRLRETLEAQYPDLAGWYEVRLEAVDAADGYVDW